MSTQPPHPAAADGFSNPMSKSHRSKNIDPEIRKQRLESCIVPVKQQWTDPGMTESLQTFQGFCRLLGLDRVQEYLILRRVHEIPDFSKHPLDADGQALQTELTEKFRVGVFFFLCVFLFLCFLLTSLGPAYPRNQSLHCSVDGKAETAVECVQHRMQPVARRDPNDLTQFTQIHEQCPWFPQSTKLAGAPSGVPAGCQEDPYGPLLASRHINREQG